MEKEMTYKEFIDNILEERGRFSCGEEYHERHHILPKCKGGIDNKENLIDLFAKEHFIAHKLLAEENPEDISLVRAYQCMTIARNPKPHDILLLLKSMRKQEKCFQKLSKNYIKTKQSIQAMANILVKKENNELVKPIKEISIVLAGKFQKKHVRK